MQVKPDKRTIPDILAGAPTIGSLVELCEQNFCLVQRLAPGVANMAGLHRSLLHNSAPLHLEVLEQTQYTTLMRLTHFFVHDGKPDADPDIHLRLYHDARQCEIIKLRQSILPVERLYDHPGLEQKWRANQFLSRWLQFCLLQGYRFDSESQSHRRAASVEPACSA